MSNASLEIEANSYPQHATPGFLERYRKVLSRTLSSWQVVFMTFNIVFGVGYFQNTTYAFKVAGTGGAALAFFVVGFIAFCVVDCTSEMLSLFPIANPMVEFVRAFVDEDLATLVGTSYWLSYAAIFNSLVISAVNLLSISTERAYATAVVWLFLLLLINLLPVRIYGHLEVIFGMLKTAILCVLLGLAIHSAVRGNSSTDSSGSVSFGSDGRTTSSNAQAVFTGISLAVAPFIGTEAVATMSAEAHNTSKVVPSMRSITICKTVVTVLLAVLTGVAVNRSSDVLTSYTNQGFGGLVPPPRTGSSTPSNIPAILAMLSTMPAVQKAMNAFLIFSAVTAGNTALYVGSRSLFGIFQRLSFNKNGVGRFLREFGYVRLRSRVPLQALLVTWVCLIWLTLLCIGSMNSHTYTNLFQLATNMAITTCLMVWATQCVAYLRFYRFRNHFSATIQAKQFELLRHERRGFLWACQPVTAWVGLIGCLALLLVFSTAVFWNVDITSNDYSWTFVGLYLSPMIGAACYMVLKVRRMALVRRGCGQGNGGNGSVYVHFGQWGAFKKVVLDLQSQIHAADYPLDHLSKPPTENRVETRVQPTSFPPPYCSARGSASAASGDSIEFTYTSFLADPPILHTKPPFRATNRIEPAITRGIDASISTDAPSACIPLETLPQASGDLKA